MALPIHASLREARRFGRVALTVLVIGLGGAALAGGVFLAAAVGFARAPRVESARRLLLVSVFYLPVVLTALVADHWWS